MTDGRNEESDLDRRAESVSEAPVDKGNANDDAPSEPCSQPSESELTDCGADGDASDGKKTRKVDGVEKRLTAIRNSPPFRLWDVAVYVVLIVAIVAVLLAVFLPKNVVSDEAVVRVFLDGQKTAEYALNVDGDYEVKSGDIVLLVLSVRGGEATVTQSVCDDHLCEKMKISGRSKQIVCLPNKVVIQLFDGIGGQNNIPGGVA